MHSCYMTTALRGTNQHLTEAVQRAIAANPTLRGLPVFATVDRGAASLYGQVESAAQAWAAEQTAMDVPGIVAVAQEILISFPPRRSASDIARLAAEALSRTAHVPDSVRATVHGRTITLTGEANWQYEREAACRAVKEIPGAQTVVNAITIYAGTMATQLEKEILATLTSRDPLSKIRLSVTPNSRGAIMLDGHLPSVEARREAEAICWAVPGTTSVTSHVEFDDDSAAVSGTPIAAPMKRIRS